jgi:HTH-type transcriptional regulator, sugar sensing transcriptional regulator
MDILTTLGRMGLSPRAASVYFASLQLGPAGMTDLARATGFKRPSVYLLVDELLLRGFMSTERKGRRTLYRAEHPSRLKQSLQNALREMERALPELEALYYEPRDKPRIRVFEGKEAMLRVYDEMIPAITQQDSEALFFTAIGDLSEHIADVLSDFMHLIKNAHPRYRMREINLGDARAKAYVEQMRSIVGKNHHIRLLDPERFPFKETDTLIYENRLCIFSFVKEIFVIVIESQVIADTYRAMFNAAWEAAGEDVL